MEQEEEDKDEFFDAESSFHETDNILKQKSLDSDKLKLLDLKNSHHVSSKIYQTSLHNRSRDPMTPVKAITMNFKYQSKKKIPLYDSIRLLQDIDLLDKQEFSQWILKFSPDSNYLSVSGTGKEIYIYNLTKKSILFMSPSPERILHGHESAVTSLSWSRDCKLISSANDGSVFMWEPTSEEHFKSYPHPEGVSSCKFFRSNPKYFVTVCKDKLMRVYDKDNPKPLGFYQLPMVSHCIDFNIDCNYLAVGLGKGEISLYVVKENFNLHYYNTIICRNRRGMFSNGRRVTGLSFITQDWLLVSTHDSRIRIIKYKEGVMIYKFKGHRNLTGGISADFYFDRNCVLSGSEDGRIYLWFLDKDIERNSKFESFEVRNRRSTEYSVFAPFKIEDEVRYRFSDGEISHVIFTIGAKDTLKIFLILSK
ncbi:hypothetical protein SteCoe_1358 [Stentor coeruleus]|uniref:Anaphase-promoting complex subunit 4 WD40 domain-containing protein n=1 Tax=Stentor coeruleus TaxID=5963 RepID=A0A1R2D271_9CILI|nr:hypothetical protein SteCoe_1358 [Stentor coeruleus]